MLSNKRVLGFLVKLHMYMYMYASFGAGIGENFVHVDDTL